MRTVLLSLVRLPIPRTLRWALLRTAGVSTQAWNIGASFFGGTDIAIGRGTFINRECLFDASAPISIGARCALGMRVSIITSSHALGGPDRRAGELAASPINVGDGCWIGGQALLLPGVTVGDGCVIAAGAVVTSDCAPNGLYAGVPAKRVRDLEH